MSQKQENLEAASKSETSSQLNTYVLEDDPSSRSTRAPISPRFYNCGKVEVKFIQSSPNERGVFAKEDIRTGDILEEVPFINITFHKEGSEYVNFLSSNEIFGAHFKNVDSVSKALGLRNVEEYLFDWGTENSNYKHSVIPLGNACIYNSSPTPNAEWYTTTDSFVFYAKKDIKAGEEIRTYYGYFLTDTGKKVLSRENLGIYAERNVNNKLCLRAVIGYEKSITEKQAGEINSTCEKGDVIINSLKFYDSNSEALAELKVDTVSSSDSFYEKFYQAKINTNFFYLELNCKENFGEMNDHKFVFYNR